MSRCLKEAGENPCHGDFKVVFDDEYDGTYGGLVGLSHDQAKNIYWTFTEYAVYR